ncbi:MAG: hypothetical protein ACUVS7_02335 [Bryobacteraceae bacterium]
MPRIGAALADAVKEYPLIWMQNSACNGCSVSVIDTIHPSIKNVVLDQILPGHQLFLNYHSTLMAAAGRLSTDAAVETAEKHKGKYVFMSKGRFRRAMAALTGRSARRTASQSRCWSG